MQRSGKDCKSGLRILFNCGSVDNHFKSKVMKSEIITPDKREYSLKFTTCTGLVCEVHFLSGWQMICYLSNINAEAQKN